MRRDYRGREDDCSNEIVEDDLADIRNSRYILVNATVPSWGTAMEVRAASELGPGPYLFDPFIIAFTDKTSVSPWLRYHTNVIVNTVEEACNIINKIAKVKQHGQNPS